MPSYRQQLWQSTTLDAHARLAIAQLVTCLVLLSRAPPGSGLRVALGLSIVLSLAPLLAAHWTGDAVTGYLWSGRLWTMLLPCALVATITGAYDGSGPRFAEEIASPVGYFLFLVLAFGLGAQGALLGVRRVLANQVASVAVVVTALKLYQVRTPAYVALQVLTNLGLWLGYALAARYADRRVAIHEVAKAVVCGAEALHDPFVVTDEAMNVLAVNARFTEVLGYEAAEIVGQNVTMLMANRFDIVNHDRWVHAYITGGIPKLRGTKGREVEVCTKEEEVLPVRLTIGEMRCPIDATKLFTAVFSSLTLEKRNAQLECEKEKLQWEVLASHHDGEDDPREHLGATTHGGRFFHRTLGAMQDQDTTDEAISCANSFDHVNSSASPTAPGRTLVAPAPARTASTGTTSCASCKSSVMDTVSQAAKKSPTRAPPPPKSSRLSRLPRPKKVCSEPAPPTKPKAEPKKNVTPKRTLPAVECVSDLRERS